MQVLIRVDASERIGTGHVMRCLTLADTLQSNGAVVDFVCREFKGNCISLIRKRGYVVHTLSPSSTSLPKKTESFSVHAHWLGADWQQDCSDTVASIDPQKRINILVVDHYGIDYRWLQAIRPHAEKLLVIDDLADRRLDCDILLDQTYGRTQKAYRQLVPEDCQMLLGSHYALLRPQFSHTRPQALAKRDTCEKVKTLLVTMGGTDPDNVTGLVLKGLESVKWSEPIFINVVLGGKAPNLDHVCRQADQSLLEISVLSDVTDMAELMVKADLAIGAGGTTTWEQCCLGVPLIVIVTASNQEKVASSLEAAGVVVNLGRSTELTPDIVAENLQVICQSKEIRKKMSAKAFSVVDGSGAERVVRRITEEAGEIVLRRGENQDCEQIFTWQSNPVTRRYCRNPNLPTWEEHQEWFAASLENPRRSLYIIEDQGMPVGVVRLDTLKEKQETAEVSILIGPAFYGQGYARRALLALRRQHPETIFVAEILPENVHSQKLFIDAGYILYDTNWYINKP